MFFSALDQNVELSKSTVMYCSSLLLDWWIEGERTLLYKCTERRWGKEMTLQDNRKTRRLAWVLTLVRINWPRHKHPLCRLVPAAHDWSTVRYSVCIGECNLPSKRQDWCVLPVEHTVCSQLVGGVSVHYFLESMLLTVQKQIQVQLDLSSVGGHFWSLQEIVFK